MAVQCLSVYISTLGARKLHSGRENATIRTCSLVSNQFRDRPIRIHCLTIGVQTRDRLPRQGSIEPSRCLTRGC
ncbi:hypothetical protein CKA32_001118 [Geitlerinema sp. FC II]|nr:hypothetical protein CKA32_001118 [Geitlerinema sp. FC II]